MVERGITVVLYLLLAWQGSTSATAYTGAFLVGALAGWLLALFWMVRTSPKPAKPDGWDALGTSWSSSRSLLFSALPFAITLGILPYVVRIEKFMVAASGGATLGAVFHVAQLVWLAGLVVPAAIRSALLPVLGSARDEPVRHRRELNHAFDMCFALLPYGLFGGRSREPACFGVSNAYLDGTHGASAIVCSLFFSQVGFDLVATPTCESDGGTPPVALPCSFSSCSCRRGSGAMLIERTGRQRSKTVPATASSLSAGVLLLLSWWMSGHVDAVQARQAVGAGLPLRGFHRGWVGVPDLLVGAGSPVFLFTKQGWKAPPRFSDRSSTKSSRSSTVSSSANPSASVFNTVGKAWVASHPRLGQVACDLSNVDAHDGRSAKQPSLRPTDRLHAET